MDTIIACNDLHPRATVRNGSEHLLVCRSNALPTLLMASVRVRFRPYAVSQRDALIVSKADVQHSLCTRVRLRHTTQKAKELAAPRAPKIETAEAYWS